MLNQLLSHHTSYAITRVKADIASGRAEDARSFARTCGSESHMFVQKIKQHHAAAGENSLQVWHQAEPSATA
jgi:hypothetical protein